METRKTTPRCHPDNFSQVIYRLKTDTRARIANPNHGTKKYDLYYLEFKKLYNFTGHTWCKKAALLLNAMLDNGVFPNAFIFGQIIYKLCTFKFTPYLLQIFDIAVARKLTNTYIYNWMLVAIENSATPNVAFALELCKQAQSNGIADSYTYKNLIDVIAGNDSPDIELAVSVLESAKAHSRCNRHTYGSLIFAMAKSPAPDTDLALKLIKEAGITLPTLTENMRLDMRGLSFGYAYFTLKTQLAELLQHPDRDQLTIMYSVYKAHKNKPFKSYCGATDAINKILREIEDYGLTCQKHQTTIGTLTITLHKKQNNYTSRLFSQYQRPATVSESSEDKGWRPTRPGG